MYSFQAFYLDVLTFIFTFLIIIWFFVITNNLKFFYYFSFKRQEFHWSDLFLACESIIIHLLFFNFFMPLSSLLILNSHSLSYFDYIIYLLLLCLIYSFELYYYQSMMKNLLSFYNFDNSIIFNFIHLIFIVSIV